MAYDAARQRIVLFGGGVSNTWLNDTWEWDGTNWIQCRPITSPPARGFHAMAYDAARRRIVLFGGWVFPQLLNDTWEWDGQSWIPCTPKTSPAGRIDHTLVYDPTRQRTVLFAGNGWVAFNDTWEWDGIDWMACYPKSSPSPRANHASAYDVARQRVVLFGGLIQTTCLNDTWEWDGIDWTARNTAASPAPRQGHGMAYDVVKGVMVLFGGLDSTPTELGDTWEYAPRDLIASSHRVSVATGGSVRFSLDAGTALAGKVYWLLGCMDGAGPRGIPAGRVTLLLNPDPYFWLTYQYPNLLIANSLGQLDSAGKATATLRVPKGMPALLVGTRYYHAFVVFQSRMYYASTPVPVMLVK